MTQAEIFAVYGAPWILVLGGALLAWRSRVEARRAHERDQTNVSTTIAAGEATVLARGKLGDNDVIFTTSSKGAAAPGVSRQSRRPRKPSPKSETAD